jgi:hypothetical protein
MKSGEFRGWDDDCGVAIRKAITEARGCGLLGDVLSVEHNEDTGQATVDVAFLPLSNQEKLAQIAVCEFVSEKQEEQWNQRKRSGRR